MSKFPANNGGRPRSDRLGSISEIKKYMENREYSSTRMAKLLEVSPSALRTWISKKMPPPADVWVRFLELPGVSCDARYYLQVWVRIDKVLICEDCRERVARDHPRTKRCVNCREKKKRRQARPAKRA